MHLFNVCFHIFALLTSALSSHTLHGASQLDELCRPPPEMSEVFNEHREIRSQLDPPPFAIARIDIHSVGFNGRQKQRAFFSALVSRDTRLSSFNGRLCERFHFLLSWFMVNTMRGDVDHITGFYG